MSDVWSWDWDEEDDEPLTKRYWVPPIMTSNICLPEPTLFDPGLWQDWTEESGERKEPEEKKENSA